MTDGIMGDFFGVGVAASLRSQPQYVQWLLEVVSQEFLLWLGGSCIREDSSPVCCLYDLKEGICESCEFCKLEVLMSLIISFSHLGRRGENASIWENKLCIIDCPRLDKPKNIQKILLKKLMCLCVCVWTYTCMHACFAGIWVHVCHGTYMESEDSSILSSQGISCFYSTACFRLWSSISSSVVVLGLQMYHSTSDCLHGFWALNLDSQTCMASTFTPNHLPTFHLEHSYAWAYMRPQSSLCSDTLPSKRPPLFQQSPTSFIVSLPWAYGEWLHLNYCGVLCQILIFGRSFHIFPFSMSFKRIQTCVSPAHTLTWS